MAGRNRKRSKRGPHEVSQESEWIGGWHAVEALLEDNKERVLQVFVDGSRNDERSLSIIDRCNQLAVPVQTVSKTQLNPLLPTSKHQGVAAEIRVVSMLDEAELESILQSLDEPPFLLVLDSITDPRNLGACLRSADAAGVHAVILPKDQSAPLNAAARKVACGAAESVPVISVTNLSRTMQWLKQYNVWFVGAAGETEVDLYQTDLRGPLAIVMGAEEKGLRRLTREHCDFLAKIPMRGQVESLNVSVATGICLFEANRQRGSKGS